MVLLRNRRKKSPPYWSRPWSEIWRDPTFVLGLVIALVTAAAGVWLGLPSTQDSLRRDYLHETDEVTGQLRPATELPPGDHGTGVVVGLGSNSLVVTKKRGERITIFSQGDEPILQVLVTKEGYMDLFANIYSRAGKIAVQLSGDSTYKIERHSAVKVRKSKSEIEVSDGGVVLFWAKFENAKVAKVQGTFHMPLDGSRTVTVDAEGIHAGGMTIQGTTFADNAISFPRPKGDLPSVAPAAISTKP